MSRIWVALLAGVATVASCVAAEAEERLAGPIVANLQKVIDGDTIVVEAPVWLGIAVTTSVRLRGIDTPELHGHCAQEKDRAEQAKRYLAQKTTAQVVLANIKGDKFYGRVEADVTTVPGGLNLSEAMLASGLARAYDGSQRGDWCGLASLGG